MRNIILLLLLLLTLTESCSNKKNGVVKNNIINLLHNYGLEHSKETKAYLFLPLDGCGKCIKISVEFINGNVDLNKIKYVVSSADKKSFSINFSEEVLESANIIVDKDLYTKIYELAINKPVLYLFKDTEIQYIIQMDDTNSENILNELLKEYLVLQ